LRGLFISSIKIRDESWFSGFAAVYEPAMGEDAPSATLTKRFSGFAAVYGGIALTV